MNVKHKATKATDLIMIPIYVGSAIWFGVWAWGNKDAPTEIEIIQRQVDALYEEEQTVIQGTVRSEKK